MNVYGNELYKQTQVTRVDQGQIVIILYEEAIKFIRKAILAQELGDLPTKVNCINQVLEIIAELNQSLNMQEGGEIAVNL
ncbi:MAG: flagellar protein FliS, partial [Deltaproteobacteria bacterium]|nr:flagellar protein FliS [Deltaproteobacteria bacterium]